MQCRTRRTRKLARGPTPARGPGKGQDLQHKSSIDSHESFFPGISMTARNDVDAHGEMHVKEDSTTTTKKKIMKFQPKA